MKDELYRLKQRKKKGESQKRRRKNQKSSLELEYYVPLIRTDDLTRWPASYCSHYQGFLTLNLMRVHRCCEKCEGKGCPHLHKDIDKYLEEFLMDADSVVYYNVEGDKT